MFWGVQKTWKLSNFAPAHLIPKTCHIVVHSTYVLSDVGLIPVKENANHKLSWKRVDSYRTLVSIILCVNIMSNIPSLRVAPIEIP